MEETYRINEVPIGTVIEDMCHPDGGMISSAARDYYYLHYACKDLQNQIDDIDVREQRILSVLKSLCIILIMVIIVIVVCKS